MLALALLLAFNVTGCEEKLRQAASALQQKNVAEVREVLNSVRFDCSGSASFQELDGVEKALSGDLPAAEIAFRNALSAQPDSARLLTELGVVQLKQNKIDGAVTSLEKSFKLDPSSEATRRYLLAAYFQAKNFSGVVKLVESVGGETNPALLRDPAALLSFVQALLETGQTERVRRILSVSGNQMSPSLLFSLGTVFATHKLYSEAAGTFERIASGDADEAVSFNLGLCYSHLRQFEKARAHYFHAIDQNLRHVDAYLHVGIDYASSGEPRKAIPWLFRARDLASGRPDIDYLLTESLIRLEYLQTATDLIQSALEKSPSQALLLTARGDIAGAKGNLSEARAAYASALQIQPMLIPALVGMARCDVAGGKDESARTGLQKALSVDPSDAAANYELGRAEIAASQWGDAARHLGRAWSADQSDTAVGVAWARALRHSGKSTEALQLLKALETEMPEVADVHVELAQVYTQLGRTSDAKIEHTVIARLSAASKDALHFEEPQTYVH